MEIEMEDNLVVRRPEDVRDWYNIMQRKVVESKTIEMQSTKEFWSKQVANHSDNEDSHFQYRYSPKSCTTASLDRRRKRDRNICK